MMGTSVTNWEQDRPNIWTCFVVSVVDDDVVLIAAAVAAATAAAAAAVAAAAAEIGSALV